MFWSIEYSLIELIRIQIQMKAIKSLYFYFFEYLFFSVYRFVRFSLFTCMKPPLRIRKSDTIGTFCFVLVHWYVLILFQVEIRAFKVLKGSIKRTPLFLAVCRKFNDFHVHKASACEGHLIRPMLFDPRLWAVNTYNESKRALKSLCVSNIESHRKVYPPRADVNATILYSRELRENAVTCRTSVDIVSKRIKAQIEGLGVIYKL